MKIKKIRLEDHPGIGNLELSFCDDQGVSFGIVVLAGASGTGKTAVLEAIQKTFEGQLSARIGIVTLDLAFDAEDLARMSLAPNGPQSFGGPVTDFKLRFDSGSNAWAGYSLSWTDPVTGPNGMTPLVMGAAEWRRVFRSFFNEANVNFEPRPAQYVTASGLDNPTTGAARSGSELAVEITQLLVDIRAADAEDLATWVRDNPGIAPPEAVQDKRFSRFSDAFDSMFPTKRFKGVTRTEKSLSIEFEEFGRTTTIENLSTGEKQIVFRASFLLRQLSEAKSSIVMLDEPELSLHPEWQERIVSFYTSILSNDQGIHPQILISTHSPFIVHGAVGAKTIILEKELATGIVREMPSPAYPAVGSSEAIRAFNIDGFLASATKPLLILTEGDSDAKLFETAWRKLRPGRSMEFELRPALGAKNTNITLNDQEVFTKLGSRFLLGVFDFDSAYNQWNGVWRKGASTLVTTSEAAGLVKRHATKNGWAMVLPVPSFRSGFASAALAGTSILSAEFLFEDCDIPSAMVGCHPVALNQSLPYFKDEFKTQFAAHASTLDPSRFLGFEPLLLRFEDILAGRI